MGIFELLSGQTTKLAIVGFLGERDFVRDIRVCIRFTASFLLLLRSAAHEAAQHNPRPNNR